MCQYIRGDFTIGLKVCDARYILGSSFFEYFSMSHLVILMCTLVSAYYLKNSIINIFFCISFEFFAC